MHLKRILIWSFISGTFAVVGHAETPIDIPSVRIIAEAWRDAGYLSQNVFQDFLNAKECLQDNKTRYACLHGIDEGLRAINSSWQLQTDNLPSQLSTTVFSGKHFQIVEKKTEPLYLFRSAKTRFELQMQGLKVKRQAWGELQFQQSDIDEIKKYLLVLFDKNNLIDAYFTSRFLNAYKSAFDPFASIEPKDLQIRMSRLPGEPRFNFGITARVIDNKLLVTEIRLGSAAYWSGIKQFDEIITMNGFSVRDLTRGDISKIIYSKIIDLKVRRDGKWIKIQFANEMGESQPKLESSIILWRGQKYLRFSLNSFAADLSLCQSMGREIQTQKASGDLGGIILDLRDNGGGFIRFAKCVNSLFLGPDKMIATEKYLDTNMPDEKINTFPLATTQFFNLLGDQEMPLVVLINGQSASASELTAGAFRDYQRAWLVGQRTYGKGTVNVPVDFAKNAKIIEYKTGSIFFQPNNTSNELVGIMPDFEVPSRLGATEEEEFVIRNEDENLDQPFKRNNVQMPQRQAEATIIKNCIDEKFLQSKSEQLSGSSIPPDYQLFYALEVLRCN